MKEARLRTGVRLRETVSQQRMGALVGAELGRALHQNQWSRYETGESEPPLDVIRVTARLSGLDQSYIAFGAVTSIDGGPIMRDSVGEAAHEGKKKPAQKRGRSA